MSAADHPPVTPRARRLLALLLAPLLLATVIGAALLWPDGSGDRPALGGVAVDATVVAVRQGPCADTAPEAGIECLTIEARLDGGGVVGLEEVPDADVAVGDDVVLRRSGSGAAVAYELGGPQRHGSLVLLVAGATVVVLVLARWRGLRLLAALAAVGVVLVAFAAPAVLDGGSEAAVAAVGAALVVVVLVVGRGVDARHAVALAGGLLAVAVGGLVAAAAGSGAHLAPRGLLIVGMTVGAAGAVVDLAVRVVDATWDLRDADPSSRWWGLTRAGIGRSGEALVATAGTLVVAYAGAALPAVALLTDGDLGDVVANGLAAEVVLAAIGVLALGAVVPLTAAVAAGVAAASTVDGGPDDPRRFRTKAERAIWEAAD